MRAAPLTVSCRIARIRSTRSLPNDRSKAATRRPKIGCLTLVKAGGHKLDLSVVGVVANIELHHLAPSIDNNGPTARWHEFLSSG